MTVAPRGRAGAPTGALPPVLPAPCRVYHIDLRNDRAGSKACTSGYSTAKNHKQPGLIRMVLCKDGSACRIRLVTTRRFFVHTYVGTARAGSSWVLF